MLARRIRDHRFGTEGLDSFGRVSRFRWWVYFISSHSFIIIFREWAQLRQRHVSTRIVTCAHTSWFGTSPSTLVQCQSQRSLAQSWHGWSKELVLLTLEKAAARLAGIQHSAESVKNTYRIASTLVHERLLKHASVLFVRTLPPVCGQNDTEVYAEKNDIEEDQCKETIDAGKSLGG